MLSREKVSAYVRAGDTSLPEHEDLLTLFVSPKSAAALWGAFGSWERLEKASPAELIEAGATPFEAARVAGVFEISRRRAVETAHRGVSIGCSEDAYQLLAPIMRSLPVEQMIVVPLDTRHRLVRSPIVVAQGGGARCNVEPAVLVRPALLAGAQAILLAHNHPSGDPEPSPEDEILTRMVQEVCSLLGLRLLDHIVVGGSGYVSMADRGVM